MKMPVEVPPAGHRQHHPLAARRHSQPLCARGLSRDQAAVYVGVSATKFDELVADGRMPAPRTIDARKVWCLFEIDEAFEVLPRAVREASAGDPWADLSAT
jgi:excisionase family DNA binding protein